MDDVDAIGLLGEPLRRKLYDFVSAQHDEVTRAQAAQAVGVERNLAAFHLDKLVDAGLLEVTTGRVNGRSGPGAGRPAKLYRRSAVTRGVSLPQRDYQTAAEVFAEAAEAVRLDDTVYEVARARGRGDRAQSIARGLDELAALDERGYELFADGEVIRMANCPFHGLATTQPGLTCGMNLALLEGMLENSDQWEVVLDPHPGAGCCTALRPKQTPPTFAASKTNNS